MNQTLIHWRKETALIDEAQKLNSNKTFSRMMMVLKGELPTNRTLPAVGSNAHDFSYAYGVEVGYRQAIAVIESMSIPYPLEQQPQAKYEETE